MEKPDKKNIMGSFWSTINMDSKAKHPQLQTNYLGGVVDYESLEANEAITPEHHS